MLLMHNGSLCPLVFVLLGRCPPRSTVSANYLFKRFLPHPSSAKEAIMGNNDSGSTWNMLDLCNLKVLTQVGWKNYHHDLGLNDTVKENLMLQLTIPQRGRNFFLY